MGHLCVSLLRYRYVNYIKNISSAISTYMSLLESFVIIYLVLFILALFVYGRKLVINGTPEWNVAMEDQTN